MRRLLISVVVVLGIVACAAVVLAFRREFSRVPPLQTSCQDHYGQIIDQRYGQPIGQRFESCIEDRARLFIATDYAEAKDLAEAFLTLLTAVLVFSITFSEKIIDFERSGWAPRTLMITCWLLLLSAIVGCGVGLAFMTEGAGWASYSPFQDYRMFELRAVKLFVFAGITFGLALAGLLMAGILSILQRHEAASGEPQLVSASR